MQVNCKTCGAEFSARPADRKRGWARFCSKSCKAREQERRTGRNARHRRRRDESDVELDLGHPNEGGVFGLGQDDW